MTLRYPGTHPSVAVKDADLAAGLARAMGVLHGHGWDPKTLDMFRSAATPGSGEVIVGPLPDADRCRAAAAMRAVAAEGHPAADALLGLAETMDPKHHGEALL
jgi:hypothetical protein